jgi:hypothetical protein
LADSTAVHRDGHQLGTIAQLDVWLTGFNVTWKDRDPSNWCVKWDAPPGCDFYFEMSGDESYMEGHLSALDDSAGNDLPDGDFGEETWNNIKERMQEFINDVQTPEEVARIEALKASLDQEPPVRWPDEDYPEHEDF